MPKFRNKFDRQESQNDGDETSLLQILVSLKGTALVLIMGFPVIHQSKSSIEKLRYEPECKKKQPTKLYEEIPIFCLGKVICIIFIPIFAALFSHFNNYLWKMEAHWLYSSKFVIWNKKYFSYLQVCL